MVLSELQVAWDRATLTTVVVFCPLTATPCSLWRGQVVVSHFPGKALARRPLLCGLPQLLVPFRLETAWPTSFRRQGVKFQVGWDWLGVGLGREMEDSIEGSLPGRAWLCTELGMFLVSWALACSFVAGEHPVTGPLCGSWKSHTEEAGECTGLRGLTRWC